MPRAAPETRIETRSETRSETRPEARSETASEAGSEATPGAAPGGAPRRRWRRRSGVHPYGHRVRSGRAARHHLDDEVHAALGAHHGIVRDDGHRPDHRPVAGRGRARPLRRRPRRLRATRRLRNAGHGERHAPDDQQRHDQLRSSHDRDSRQHRAKPPVPTRKDHVRTPATTIRAHAATAPGPLLGPSPGNRRDHGSTACQKRPPRQRRGPCRNRGRDRLWGRPRDCRDHRPTVPETAPRSVPPPGPGPSLGPPPGTAGSTASGEAAASPGRP
jgi:hypothetical protein